MSMLWSSAGLTMSKGAAHWSQCSLVLFAVCTASLQAKLPRIARVGDRFQAGATVTMTDPDFRGDVRVLVTITNKGAGAAAPLKVRHALDSA
jgi:hypothetical protein